MYYIYGISGPSLLIESGRLYGIPEPCSDAGYMSFTAPDIEQAYTVSHAIHAHESYVCM